MRFVVTHFSQDQDFAEAVKEARERLKAEARKIVFACVFPYKIGVVSKSGVFGTNSAAFDQDLLQGVPARLLPARKCSAVAGAGE